MSQSAAEDRAARLRDTAERAWAWALDQVGDDADGPWLPETVPVDVVGAAAVPDPEFRDSLYDGIAGLAPALLEVRRDRPWTSRERDLADAVVGRLAAACSTTTEPCLYSGVAGHLTALHLLKPDAVGPALDQLTELATPGGWPTTIADYRPVIHDVVLGTAGVTLAALFTRTARGDELGRGGAAALMAAAEPAPDGLAWPMSAAPQDVRMPNYSHGTAGIAAALAVAGARLSRPDWTAAAVRGAEHLLSIADLTEGRCRVPVRGPDAPDRDRYAYGWCHGSVGDALLWSALQHAGVGIVGDRPLEELWARSLQAALISGLPERRYPGFWDNDGRCCGTTGVADAMFDGALRDVGGRGAQWLAFGLQLADTLVERAVPVPGNPAQCYWRFLEHRRDPPLLDPAPGWMQGAAGISALLRRAARAQECGRPGGRVALPDTWWAVEL